MRRRLLPFFLVGVHWVCFRFPSIVASGQHISFAPDDDGSICSDGSYLDRCLSKLPETVDESLLRRMPVSEDEIDSLCRGFRIGMACIDEYSDKCLVPAKRKFLHLQISGAKKIFNSLCNDGNFKSEYLKHTVCLRGTRKNWESCVTQFTQIVRDEIQKKNLTRETEILHTCCATHGFRKCIYVPGRLKCHKEAAVFLLKMAEMSIDRGDYLTECHTIDAHKVCEGCRIHFSRSLFFAFLLYSFYS